MIDSRFVLVIITEAISSLLETVLIYYWAKSFSDEMKRKKLIILKRNILIFFVLFICALSSENSIISISILYVLSFISLFLENKKYQSALFLSLIFSVVAIISDMLAGVILMIFSNNSLNFIVEIVETRVIGNLIAKIIALIFVGSIYFKNKVNFKMPKSKVAIYFIILPISSIVILYQMSRYDYGSTNIQDGILNLIGILGLIIANISVFIFFGKESEYEDQKEREIFLREQIENQKEYYRALETSQEEIQRLQHDMKNSFIALSGYIKEKNLIAAKDYLDIFTEKIENIQASLNTGYPAIDALINSKLNKARKNDIKIKHKIILPKNLSIDEIDLCIVLGNALDNAIEGISLVNKTEKYIVFNTYVYGGDLFIYIENKMLGNLVLKDGFLLSTKKDKANHGYGLANIERILKNYDGEMHYKSESTIFKLYITFKHPNYV